MYFARLVVAVRVTPYGGLALVDGDRDDLCAGKRHGGGARVAFDDAAGARLDQRAVFTGGDALDPGPVPRAFFAATTNV